MEIVSEHIQHAPNLHDVFRLHQAMLFYPNMKSSLT